jgi:transcriptional regulator GlxA family with amidase domain
MLSSTSDSVAQIASKVGYDSEQSFNRAFKRNFGDPPARYRNETKSKRNNAEPRTDDICLQAVVSR